MFCILFHSQKIHVKKRRALCYSENGHTQKSQSALCCPIHSVLCWALRIQSFLDQLPSIKWKFVVSNTSFVGRAAKKSLELPVSWWTRSWARDSICDEYLSIHFSVVQSSIIFNNHHSFFVEILQQYHLIRILQQPNFKLLWGRGICPAILWIQNLTKIYRIIIEFSVGNTEAKIYVWIQTLQFPVLPLDWVYQFLSHQQCLE